MPTFATLGTIEFQLLTSPTSMELGAEYNYAEHATILGKPTLQKVGEKLRSLTLDFNFHVSWCNPQEQYESLTAAADSDEPLPLVIGEKFLDNWVILSIDQTVTKFLPDASLMAIKVSVNLKEYAGTETTESAPASGFIQNSGAIVA
jgi:phage protein U